MSSTTAAPGLAGAWFGELASALQGRWQQAVAAGGEQGPRQQQKLGGGVSLVLSERSTKAAAGGASGDPGNRKTTAPAKVEEADVGLCGATVSDATLYLLLDRFTPN